MGSIHTGCLRRGRTLVCGDLESRLEGGSPELRRARVGRLGWRGAHRSPELSGFLMPPGQSECPPAVPRQGLVVREPAWSSSLRAWGPGLPACWGLLCTSVTTLGTGPGFELGFPRRVIRLRMTEGVGVACYCTENRSPK